VVTYLATTAAGQHEAMQRFEERIGRITTKRTSRRARRNRQSHGAEPTAVRHQAEQTGGFAFDLGFEMVQKSPVLCDGGGQIVVLGA
jgi:hypothetical protein